MLLVANFSNTKNAKTPYKIKTLLHGYSSESKGYPINTNMTGFRWSDSENGRFILGTVGVSTFQLISWHINPFVPAAPQKGLMFLLTFL